jgi:hypothetical protein
VRDELLLGARVRFPEPGHLPPALVERVVEPLVAAVDVPVDVRVLVDRNLVPKAVVAVLRDEGRVAGLLDLAQPVERVVLVLVVLPVVGEATNPS